MGSGRTSEGADWRGPVLLGLVFLLPLLALLAMTIGRTSIPLSTIIQVIWQSDGSREALIVEGVRLPRVVSGVIVGSALASAGAIMQAVTANPLASPSLLGVNAGAAFALVVAMFAFGGVASTNYIWWAFAGAGTAAVVVYALGSAGRGGATPVRLALAGAVVASFLAALTTSILIFDTRTLGAVRLWTIGSLAGRQMDQVVAVLPYWAIGLSAAVVFRGQIMTLSLGAMTARAIGQNLALWRGVSAAVVVALAGGAVALAGPVAFVGLIVPHLARMLVGADYRWIIPYSAIMGALMVVFADNGIRLLLPERDVPVGITLALFGAPFFVYLARYRIGPLR
ncbi:MAG: iron ABC transporter permease [Pseudomonadota bacterium]